MKNLSLIIIVFGLLIAGISSAEAQSSAIDLYRVGIDDIINIKVIDHPDLLTTTSVSSDGTITFPFLGTIYVKGMRISEIEEEIKKELSEGYVKYPVVTVSLVKSLSKRIYAYGELMRRGEIPYEDNMTVMRAISIIGGFSKEGLFGKLIVRRKGRDSNEYKDLVEADINNGFFSSRKVENMLLKPDDIVIVERSATFLIEGEVAQRGRFVLEKDMTVLRALLQAGGVTENGKYGTLRIRRKEGETGGYKDIAEARLNEGTIESREVEDTLLQPDDILIVERNKTFLFQGEVAQRGRFVLENEMTVLEALLQAGGVTSSGSFGKIKVRRKQDGESGKFVDFAESDLIEGVIENSEVERTQLQADDVLIVERNKTFLIYGEVNKIGEFVLQKDMTVFKALTIAGGFNKWGSKGKVKVLRTNKEGTGVHTIKVDIGDVIDGDVSADVRVQEGDIIIVSAGIL